MEGWKFLDVLNLLQWDSFASGLLDKSNLPLHINWNLPVRGKYSMSKYSAEIDSSIPRGAKLM